MHTAILGFPVGFRNRTKKKKVQPLFFCGMCIIVEPDVMVDELGLYLFTCWQY